MQHHGINYLEIPTVNLAKTKTFFNQVFDWQFQDYGPDYSCFLGQGIDGGFFTAEKAVDTSLGAPLIVIYSKSLEETLSLVETEGGKVVKPIFAFPGGRRFHFQDPAGGEFAVWSE